MDTKKMLSFDISTTKSGLAYWENKKYKESYVIDLSDIKDIDERTDNMGQMLISALNYFKPDTVFIEDSYKGKNPKALKCFCRLHGIVIGWCMDHGVSHELVMPSSWRKYIPDFPNGRGAKREEQKNFSITYVINKYHINPKTDDEADAILVGEGMLCKHK